VPLFEITNGAVVECRKASPVKFPVIAITLVSGVGATGLLHEDKHVITTTVARRCFNFEPHSCHGRGSGDVACQARRPG
jgi:hypothetical protein